MVDGLIFTNWSLVEQIPPSVRKRCIGLDFGFTNHPSAAVLVGLDIEARALYLHELFYATHMLTDNLIDALAPYREEIVSESADPRLIAELRNAGLWVTPVSKPAGSVQAGITQMQTFDIYITQSSHNVIREIKNYVWEQNKDGGFVNQPVKDFDHAMDAVRYVVYEKTLGRNVGPISKDDLGL
jgi:phage terminase large subunit